MEIKPFMIQSFEVFLMESGGVLVQTPLQLNLPVPVQVEMTPAIVIGNKETFKTLFPVKGNPFSLERFTYQDFESIWATYRKAPVPLTTAEQMNPNRLFQQEVTTQDTADGEPASDSNDKDLAQQLDQSLIIQECNPESSGHNTKPNADVRARRVIGKSRKIRKVPIRSWKWFAPEIITPFSSFITSKAAFKLTFYCINLRDPKRVMSMRDIRFILRSLGYTQMAPEQGLVNSARSYLRQFKRWEPDKPRGQRHFMELVKDESKVKEYLELANSLLSCLDSKKGFKWA